VRLAVREGKLHASIATARINTTAAICQRVWFTDLVSMFPPELESGGENKHTGWWFQPVWSLYVFWQVTQGFSFRNLP
jgi:hypothetical protein